MREFEMARPLATLRGVSKHYGGHCVVDGLDLDLNAGQVLALLGPNGAGKSTTVGLLLGLIPADGGSLALCGHAPGDLQARRATGVMLQEAALPSELRVRELIELCRASYPQPLALDEAARRAEVTDLLGKSYGALSGGQKRRVQFALAICGNPLVLFLDEPTTGLDIEARTAMWATIRAFVARGSAVLLTTHYLEEAEALADRVIVLDRGRATASGSVDEIRARVSGRRIVCRTSIDVAVLRIWAGVRRVSCERGATMIDCDDAESLLRRLLAADAQLSELEVIRPGLAEAFVDLTRRAA